MAGQFLSGEAGTESERELHRQLHDPRIHGIEDLSKLRAIPSCSYQRRSGSASAEAVGQVKRLHPQLDTSLFLHAEDARQRGVDLEETRARHIRPAGVTERTQSRLLKCRWIDPA